MNAKAYLSPILVALSLELGGCAALPAADAGARRGEAIAVIDKVNTYWQAKNPAKQWAFWDIAAYHTGNIEAYRVTGKEAFRRYSEEWAEHNAWKGATSSDKAAWKYNYGETAEHVLFGDWQICFQTYADLYMMEKEPRKGLHKIARAREVMEYQMSTPNEDYWWWADGLYMVMPVMTKMYRITGNRQYLEKLHAYFEYANGIMYDPGEQLYYRDAKYVYPKHRSFSGKKDFWARGDGWVFAGLAKVLDELPADDPQRARYVERFQAMAAALLRAQQPEGYWTRSLLDPVHAPGPETSGTAFFTYGLLWGINHGLLPRGAYLPAAQRGWRYLADVAVQPDGKVGYVQPIGERAIPGQVVNQDSTAPFGVGAVLLAAAEMARLAGQ